MGGVVVVGRFLDLWSGGDCYRVSGGSISHGQCDNHEVGILERLGDEDRPGAEHSDGDLVSDDIRDHPGFTVDSVVLGNCARWRGGVVRSYLCRFDGLHS